MGMLLKPVFRSTTVAFLFVFIINFTSEIANVAGISVNTWVGTEFEILQVSSQTPSILEGTDSASLISPSATEIYAGGKRISDLGADTLVVEQKQRTPEPQTSASVEQQQRTPEPQTSASVEQQQRTPEPQTSASVEQHQRAAEANSPVGGENLQLGANEIGDLKSLVDSPTRDNPTPDEIGDLKSIVDSPTRDNPTRDKPKPMIEIENIVMPLPKVQRT
jgi:hypothetical protein